MSSIETVSVSQGGDVPIPPTLRQLTGIDAGSLVTLEARGGTIVIRPVGEDIEVYTPERKAEFCFPTRWMRSTMPPKKSAKSVWTLTRFSNLLFSASYRDDSRES